MYAYAIGDTHGDLVVVEGAIKYLESVITPDDLVVWLGDYIDRGPSSKQCVDAIIAFQQKHLNTICLCGNHERMLLDASKEAVQVYSNSDQIGIGPKTHMWWCNGGDKAMMSYDAWGHADWQAIVPEEHWNWFKNLKIDYRWGDYLFVHAGILPDGVTWAAPDYDPRLWITKAFADDTSNYGFVVIYGHSPKTNPPLPKSQPNKIGIDTGAIFGGRLSIIRLDKKVIRRKNLHPIYQLTQINLDGSIVTKKTKTSR